MKERLPQTNRKTAAYFNIFHGGISSLREIQHEYPPSIEAVRILLESGKAIGQHFIHEDGTPDMLVWMPEKRKLNDTSRS